MQACSIEMSTMVGVGLGGLTGGVEAGGGYSSEWVGFFWKREGISKK